MTKAPAQKQKNKNQNKRILSEITRGAGTGPKPIYNEPNMATTTIHLEKIRSKKDDGIQVHNRDDTTWQVSLSSERVRISIAGDIFETFRTTLERYPNSLLGDPTRREQFYDAEKDVFFFDRHRPSFPAILYFYQSKGAMARPLDVPMEIFVDEVMFFQLTELLLEKTEDDKRLNKAWCRPRHRTWCENSREFVWNMFEKPETGSLAKLINFISIFFILLSVCSFCLETLPVYQDGCSKTGNIINTTVQINIKDYNPQSKKFPFWIIETICISFFTIEYVLRYWSSPDRCAFIRDVMNLIDLSAIVPYYFDIIVQVYFVSDVCQSADENEITNKAAFLMVLRTLRLARIVRIAKLSRHSRNLNTLIKTMITSLRELSFLMLFFIVSMVLYATFVYYCEQNEKKTTFTSIPASFWWAIVTMTTVGYGDMAPTTTLGKVIGFMCAITGVLCIALPVPSIVSNFHRLYQEDQIMNPNGNNTYKDLEELKKCQLRKKFLNNDI